MNEYRSMVPCQVCGRTPTTSTIWNVAGKTKETRHWCFRHNPLEPGNKPVYEKPKKGYIYRQGIADDTPPTVRTAKNGDRLFKNRRTGKKIVSVNNGMMGRGVMKDHPDWVQIPWEDE